MIEQTLKMHHILEIWEQLSHQELSIKFMIWFCSMGEWKCAK